MKPIQSPSAVPEAVQQLLDGGVDGAVAGLASGDVALRGLSLLMLEVLLPDDQRTVAARAALPARPYRVTA
jgi:hypothetical protein